MAFGGVLPLYSKRNGSWTLRRIFRSREKVLIFLVCLTFLFICIGPIFFLPDLRGGLSTRVDHVYKVYKQMQKAGPELILPPPPPQSGEEGAIRKHEGLYHIVVDHNDIHLSDDKQRLMEKINNDEELRHMRVIEKPVVLTVSSTVANKGNQIVGQVDESVRVQNGNEVELEKSGLSGGDGKNPLPVVQGGEDRDPVARQRRDKVKEMVLHAWRGYKTYAWGKNELRPVSKRGHTAGIFGRQDMGATIVDALDTLYIMGLMDEFNEGRAWVQYHLDFNQLRSEMSVFETNIRFVGGLLSVYSLTGDPLFRDRALHIARKLLPAFDTPTGIPYALINVANGIAKNYAWASGGSSILSEFGTLHLEFVYLSDISGDPVFREKVMRIRDVIRKTERPDGLYPNYMNPKTGKWGQRHTSIGALGDSFYEYLIKAYIQSGAKDEIARDMYVEAIGVITNRLVLKSHSGLTYIAESKFNRLEHKMDHLACFSGGMYALGAKRIESQVSATHMEIAEGLANTCHESYIRTPTGLGPESFRFTEGIEARALKSSEKYYILRPEVIETWFYMWRFTKDQKYRDWAWEAILALEKYCRAEAGYSGIQNVYMENPQKDDVQQSFIFAETFKYLYLIFSDDSLLSLDEWVLNTEAHPIPVDGNNAFYRKAQETENQW
ncbi:mannosyl-oligosaccharide alpha-1,2-mannosidase IA-like [Homarus americanus]|uniref:mannosyl-oligosaccharide alpha-1,2-mannosidase IA-like n=1 Tax=Homarus americanus TaxID=6706 RepID=UPI001C453817|nr:mannosyl-oligosaccharide alpha-1,2-mannosidase IA-like [Homarus americanus]